MLRRRPLLTVVTVNVVVLVALLCMVEGAASLTVLAYRALISRPLAERRHTEHDPLLGWTHRPGLSIPDMYGAGRDLDINAQRLRATAEYAAGTPPGRTRVVCTGDSFTLGNGVGNEDAWCHRLEVLDDRLQTLNMGQGGYGVDQAYLRYRRDGGALEHQIHLFAFITEDLHRARADDFLGYPKPLLTVREGRLELTTDPVPPPNPIAIFYHQNLWQLRDLNVMRVARKLMGAGPLREDLVGDAGLRALLGTMLTELGRDDGSAVRLLLHLPMLGDFTGDQSDAWRAFMREQAGQHGMVYVDLIEAFRRLPPEEIEGFYIGAEDTEYVDTPGHFNERGNALVAEMVLAALMAIPEARRIVESRAAR